LVSDTILGVIAGAVVSIVSIVASVAGTISSRRSSERQLIVQLQNEETKRAVVSLHGLMMESKQEPILYASDISKFLDSMDSAYLPDPVRTWATKKLDEFWDEMAKMVPESTVTEEEAKQSAEEYEAYLEDLDPEERNRELFQGYREKFRKEATSFLQSSISGRPIKKRLLTKVKQGLLRIPRRTKLKIKLGYHRLRERFRRAKPKAAVPVGPT
jgi:6-pyruvoyl-tetrahydropterin synthase